MVALARARSPFYAELLRDVDPLHFRLSDLPTVNKTQMMSAFDRVVTDSSLKRAELEDFLSDPGHLGQWYRGRYAITRTSGTQGIPALIVQNRDMLELLFALQMTRGTVIPSSPLEILPYVLHRKRIAAITLGRGFYPSAVSLAYTPPEARWFTNWYWLDSIEPLEEVVDKLNRFQPEVLVGYASVLEILAREAQAGRLRLGCLCQVTNISEPLSEGASRLIGQAFGLPIVNSSYATGECMALSSGCPKGHGMHLHADWAVLEVVDSRGRPVEPGRAGDKVLLTNLYNTIQPFIRYEIPDVVTMSATPCPCGSPMPLILSVAGRTDEAVWVRAGQQFRQVHPYMFLDVLDEYPPLGWYQIVQRQRNGFLLRAAPAPSRHLLRDELQGVLRQGLQRYGLSDLLQFDVEIAPDVAPDARSGKLKRISSLVGPPDLGGV